MSQHNTSTHIARKMITFFTRFRPPLDQPISQNAKNSSCQGRHNPGLRPPGLHCNRTMWIIVSPRPTDTAYLASQLIHHTQVSQRIEPSLIQSEPLCQPGNILYCTVQHLLESFTSSVHPFRDVSGRSDRGRMSL
jgi:hypothetical protein